MGTIAKNSVKKQATKKQSKKVAKTETLTAEIVQNEFIEIVQNNNVQSTELINIVQLSDKDRKRMANPQFSHLASKAKKLTILETKSDLKKTILASKVYIDRLKNEIDTRDLSFFENLNSHILAIKFVNYILKNDALLSEFDAIVKKDKYGLYNEYKTTQSIQKVAKFSIEKNYSFSEAINYIRALNYQSKKELM